MRIGHGFDVHAFGGEGPIIIGGVRIPYEKGLLAHSDGDVALHALTDALLGAAALGDIGKLFPDTDPAFKGADSRELLREAWRRIQARGYTLGNVDVTIIAQAPKMLPHIPQMRVFIAEDLGCHMDDVNVKATTTEKLGFTGGGGTNPACIRYGWGFAQGANDAAKEMDKTVDLNYSWEYGASFQASPELQTMVSGWYSNGTQVVFACGGGIYTSAVEAALKNNGYVVGVDVDQNYIGVNGVADGSFAYNPFITSAMKGLTEAVNTALSDIEAGDWSDIAASNGNFGLEDGDYIGLPTDADSWNFETFTTDEYEALKSKIKSGEIVVDNSSDDSTKPTVSEFTTVNYIQ